MSVGKSKLAADVIDFKSACRENTGAHMLDSGGLYGRWHDRPEITGDCPEVLWSHAGCSAVLQTWAVLDKLYKIDRDLQARWEAYDAEHPDLSWFDSGEGFMEGLTTENEQGYVRQIMGNTYNEENDLTQMVICEVWNTEDDAARHDAIYGRDDTVVVIYIHTGCDVRGGYGRPIFCRCKADYSYPVDITAEYRVTDARRYSRRKPDDSGPDLLSHDDCCALCEKWSSGYSRWPYGRLEEDVERWFEFTRGIDSVCVKLKTGEICRVEAVMPYYGC